MTFDEPPVVERRAEMRLRQLSGPRRINESLETTGSNSLAPISSDRRRDSIDKLRHVLAERVVNNPATRLGADEANQALDAAARALRNLADSGPEAQLSPVEDIMLEAVIEVDGSRPSIPVMDGYIDVTNPLLEDWQGDIVGKEAELRTAIASTGRLIRGGDLTDDAVYGTAWVVGPGLIATAQHVLEALYVKIEGQWIERFGGEITIDFNVEDGRPAQPDKRVRVIGVDQPSPDLIGTTLDLAKLDAAILKLDISGSEHPPALTHSTTIAPNGNPKIHVIGHPARPTVAEDNPAVPVEELTVLTGRILQLVFGDSFGVKRWSPGEFLTNPGSIPGDVNGRVMTHDASTLGGNSGSPIFDLVDKRDRVVGLHYAGRFRDANYCHPTAKIADHLRRTGVVFV